ncbi:unnamed protein product [Calicophoron daubneyi]|uniref:Ras-related protein Rab-28 n=1 Tax=Calicophoron daubneyi TaxID=300641 RepID=A0AAV2TIG6_CALDB
MDVNSDSEEELQVLGKQLKLVVVGDGASGKTTLITRYAEGEFDRDYIQTVGVDFFRKSVILPGDVEANVHLWDIGGQTLGGEMLERYLYGCQAVLFVYDITNVSSFENLEDWFIQVKKVVSGQQMVPPHYALVANKTDLHHMCVVGTEKHVRFAHEHEMTSYFVSAKTGESVNQCFLRIISAVLGIRLTFKDLEKHRAVLRANVEPVGDGRRHTGYKAANSAVVQTSLNDSRSTSGLKQNVSSSNLVCTLL